MTEIKQLLKRYFGYDNFLLGQEELLNSILSGRDVLGVMPTGSGKSICYQLPGIIFDGLTIIISPLISLMKDQVNILKINSIASAYINSSLSYDEYESVIDGILSGKYKIIYVAPERLESDDFLETISHKSVSMVAIDEAHCVSQWGHDFRPSYLKIQEFISKINGDPVIAAFTATATKNVRKDIVNQIGLTNPNIVSTGYDRKNLYFEVRKKKDKFPEVLKILALEEGNSGIIYCTTRKTVEEVTTKLIDKGYNATRYHAGLSDSERNKNQEKFILDEKPVMVATNAFGMGIDKSNVNFVIHYNMPKNLEHYYQEAGRAGRDGSPARCILLYSYQDIIINKFLIEKTIERENYKDSKLKINKINQNYKLLNKIQGYCTTKECYRQYILNYFGDSFDDYCGNCYNCNGDFEEIDVKNEAIQIVSTLKSLNKKNRNFGKTMIIDILKGSKTKKIRDFSFDQLPSYNQLNNKSKEEIGLIIDFLIDKKYLRISGNKYPVIKLWKDFNNIFDNETQLKMKIATADTNILNEKKYTDETKPHFEDELNSFTKSKKAKSNNISKMNITKNKSKMNTSKYAKSKRDKSIKKDKTSKINNDSINKINNNSNDLFENLRKVRLNIAKNEGIPPFMIFHDSTLNDMCKRLPNTKNEFLKVSGVGKVKLEKYGEIFINAINNWSNVNNTNKNSNNNSLEYNLKYNENNYKNNNSDVKKGKLNNSIKELNKSEDIKIDSNLFKKLKEIRIKISKDEGIPAFMIFHDSSLREMCKHLPTSKSEFLAISGVGEVKLKKYANTFIEAIENYQ
ncbi:MAG: RecQ family ATP-dependent DNA helicase [Methanobrevibacter sp.]|jgi:ATP-dependent DNA helicase RecQ|nr:RecQ family ATP-dependent DNA helicase [Candidatus Methanovirga meridionalis]